MRRLGHWLVRSWRPLGWGLALSLVVLYGAYLRFDALVGKYGPFSRPAWLASAAETVGETREGIVPAGWEWQRSPTPYVGDDAINYLRFGREMQSFYQAHVREPLFVAMIHALLPWVDGQDVAVSFASAIGSTLAILATFLLGSAVASRLVGLVAAAILAVEGELVAWAPDGSRDDLFTATVACAGWAALRYGRERTWRRAAVLGAVWAAAMLTRLSALTFIVPTLLVLIGTATRSEWRIEGKRLAVAGGVALVLAGPYLVNCYRQFGDPLYAINVHTRFYRASEGLPYGTRMSAVAYTMGKFGNRPITQVDTAVRGLVEFPFAQKFRGFPSWPRAVSRMLAWLAALGLFAWIWSPPGRLALVMLFASLTPYMLTWILPSGQQWRFTMHAYPFYLVAAVAVAVRLLMLRPRLVRRIAGDPPARRRLAAIVVSGAALIAGAGLWNRHSPAILASESLVAGMSASIETGPRDGIFYRAGWSPLTTSGAVTSRFAIVSEPVVEIPLPEERPYRLVVRLDPLPAPAGTSPPPIEVWLASVRLGTILPILDPSRVGSYELEIPASLAGGGLTPLRFVTTTLRPAGDLAMQHTGLHPEMPVSFRLWYIRLESK